MTVLCYYFSLLLDNLLEIDLFYYSRSKNHLRTLTKVFKFKH